MDKKRLVASKSGAARILAGHPWVFRDDLKDGGEEGVGEVLPLFDGKNQFLGQGFYNPLSRIAFRLITRGDAPVDSDYWKEKLEAAIQRRDALEIRSNARRLVYSEADGFPGLIVDDYGGCLVLQILSLGMENLRDLLLEQLEDLLSPTAVLVRNDAPVRKLEGLEQEKGVIAGTLPPLVTVREDDLELGVDLLNGQKTGAYLDQRDNRLHLRSFAQGKRVLDAFSYDGWFALHLARAGAEHVMAMDSSRNALERVKANMELNDITGIEPVRANCFDALKSMDESFDLIVLDPPPFARRKMDIRSALRAYRDINARALRCLKPGGLLFTCCCSHGVSQDKFSGAVAAAAGKCRRKIILMEQRLQPLDHPILFNEPESLYLKGLLIKG